MRDIFDCQCKRYSSNHIFLPKHEHGKIHNQKIVLVVSNCSHRILFGCVGLLFEFNDNTWELILCFLVNYMVWDYSRYLKDAISRMHHECKFTWCWHYPLQKYPSHNFLPYFCSTYSCIRVQSWGLDVVIYGYATLNLVWKCYPLQAQMNHIKNLEGWKGDATRVIILTLVWWDIKEDAYTYVLGITCTMNHFKTWFSKGKIMSWKCF